MRAPVIVPLCLSLVSCSRPPATQLAATIPSPSTPPGTPPLTKFIAGVWNTFLDGRYEGPNAEQYLDATLYVLPVGIPPNELPSKVGRTNFEYITRDQIEPLAKQQATDIKAFSYFRLSMGRPTREGWRTLSLTHCPVWKDPLDPRLIRGSGAGSYSYAEVPIEGHFHPVCFMGIIE